MSKENQAYDYTQFEISSEIEPDAQPGSYGAVVSDVRVTATEKDGNKFPMLILDWKIEEAIDGDSGSVDHEVASFMTFYPKGHKNYKMSVRTRQELFDALGVDNDVLPKQSGRESDWDELKDALIGKRTTIFVVPSKKDPTMVNVNFRAPKGGLGVAATETDETPRKNGKKARR